MSETLCAVQGPNQSSCQAPGGGTEEAERCPAARVVERVENQAAIDVTTDGPPHLVSLPSAVFQALDLAIAVGDLREAAALILATPDPFADEDHARERFRLENDQIERRLRLRSRDRTARREADSACRADQEAGPSRAERIANLDAAIAEGRILRGAWTSDGDQKGSEKVGILAALSPEADKAKSAAACPASVIPPWLAHLTLGIDISVSEAAWPNIIRRYAAVIRRASVLTEEDWRRLDYAARAVALRVALSHAADASSAITKITKHVLALCDRAARGEIVTENEWERARAEAWVEEAWAALYAMGAGASSASETVNEAVASADPEDTADASTNAAKAAATDAIANGVLHAIGAACEGKGP